MDRYHRAAPLTLWLSAEDSCQNAGNKRIHCITQINMLIPTLSVLLGVVSHAWRTRQCLPCSHVTDECQISPLSAAEKPCWCCRTHIAYSLLQINPFLSLIQCYNILLEITVCCYLYSVSTAFSPILLLDFICRKRRHDTHFHFMHPAVRTVIQIITIFPFQQWQGAVLPLNLHPRFDSCSSQKLLFSTPALRSAHPCLGGGTQRL